ncbi:MAG: hypothetical protein JWN17_2580, partial [Frankiales bacterium]|nr:hypothetical protein [Frankiales bacterium]
GAAAGALLPAGATRIVLCRVAGDGVTRRVATPAERAVVEDVLADPIAVPFTRVCPDGSAPYEVAATWPSGPAVLLSVAPGCDPEVENGSLAAQLSADGTRRLLVVLGHVR